MTISGELTGAQICLLSTRKSDTGTFARLLEEAHDRGLGIYAWCVLDVMEKCERKCQNDEKYGNCPIFKHCQGLAHDADGFYKVKDVIRKYKGMSDETFESQWLNRRPSREIVVYGREWEEWHHYIDPLPRQEAWIVLSGIDFGAGPGHPFVYSKFYADLSEMRAALLETAQEYMNTDIQSGILNKALITYYLFYEYRSTGATMADHAEKIRNSPDYEEGEIIFADPSAKQARIDLQSLYNVVTFPADNAVDDGVDLLRLHLRFDKEQGWPAHFYVFKNNEDWNNPELRSTVWEFGNYKYARLLDGRPNRRSPMQVNDHGMDVCRYVVKSAPPFILAYLLPQMDDVEQGGYWFEERTHG